jgi:hypothetical protein
MKHSLHILCGCGLVLIAVLLSAGCTFPPGNAPPTPAATPAMTPVPTPVLPSPTASAPCGLTSCHGLSLACGADAPQVCTMEYRIGDKCRKYAHCSTAGGSCTLVTDPEFAACKACVERCEIGAGPDSLVASSCEEQC